MARFSGFIRRILFSFLNAALSSESETRLSGPSVGVLRAGTCRKSSMTETTRRIAVTLLVAFTLAGGSLAGCGGGDPAADIPEPGSADDPLKDAPAPSRPVPAKNTPDAAKK